MWCKISPVGFLDQSQSTRVTDRRTNGRTDRITTPNTALAQLRRAVKKYDRGQNRRDAVKNSQVDMWFASRPVNCSRRFIVVLSFPEKSRGGNCKVCAVDELDRPAVLQRSSRTNRKCDSSRGGLFAITPSQCVVVEDILTCIFSSQVACLYLFVVHLCASKPTITLKFQGQPS